MARPLRDSSGAKAASWRRPASSNETLIHGRHATTAAKINATTNMNRMGLSDQALI